MRKAWPYLAVALLAAAFAFVVGGEGGRRKAFERADSLLGYVVPQKDDGACFSFAASIDPTGARPVLRTGDEQIELDWENGMAAKTQIPQTWTMSFTIAVFCGATSPGVGVTGVDRNCDWLCRFPSAGIPNGECELTFQEGLLVGGVLTYRFDARATVWDAAGNDFNSNVTIDWPADGAYHRISGSVVIDMEVKETHTEAPIGSPNKVNATHAKECEGKDEWYAVSNQTITATLGTATRNAPAGAAVDASAEAVALSGTMGGHWWVDTTEGVRLEDVEFNGAGINADQLDKVLDPNWTGGSWTGLKIRALGGGDTIRFLTTGPVHSARFPFNESVHAPRKYSFSGLSVADMDGTELSGLKIWCTGVQEYTDGAWRTVKHTLAEWQALTLSPDHGVYSWDENPPPEGAIRLLGDVAFYIDRDSARELLLEGAQGDVDMADVSFDHDGRIIINGWPLSATTRTEDPWV